MDGGYDNPITLMDELLMRFPFSSCHIWVFKLKILLKNALEICTVQWGGGKWL
jgi:hypothetical protein